MRTTWGRHARRRGRYSDNGASIQIPAAMCPGRIYRGMAYNPIVPVDRVTSFSSFLKIQNNARAFEMSTMIQTDMVLRLRKYECWLVGYVESAKWNALRPDTNLRPPCAISRDASNAMTFIAHSCVGGRVPDSGVFNVPPTRPPTHRNGMAVIRAHVPHSVGD